MGSFLPAILAEKLRRGATVLSASEAVAQRVRRAFDETMRRQGQKLWETPSVFALETWMRMQWQALQLSGAERRLLLNRSQELSVWRSLLAAGSDVSGHRSLDALAQLCARAWKLVCLYEGRPHMQQSPLSTDSRAFQGWAQQFEVICARNLYLSSAQLPVALVQSLSRNRLTIPRRELTLVDFDGLAPAEQRLVDGLRSAGWQVDEVETAVTEGALHLSKAATEQSELQAAAIWTRQQLEQNPEACVAIVIPDLERRRSAIERIFGDVLAPACQPITAASQMPAYEFSLGRALDGTAEVATALDLLRWAMGPLAMESVSAVLLSRTFGVSLRDAGAQVAAEFDAFELRRTHTLSPQLTLDATINLILRSKRRAQLGDLLFRLRAMAEVAAKEEMGAAVDPARATSEPTLRNHAEWIESFRNVLHAFGWDRDTDNDPLAHAIYQRWESALDETATLGFDGSRRAASETFDALTRIAHQTIFAPRSCGARVQILGPLELGGIPFDALWFLGADDRSWPRPAVLNPLLSPRLQRSLGMPGSSRDNDHLAAEVLTERIARSASTVIFSYAAQTEAGECKLSSALHRFALPPLLPPEIPIRSQPPAFDTCFDSVPLPPLPDAVIRGGANILELQAACGFRAFAERRLWSSELNRKEPGLDARERGSVVHTIMEAIWSRLGSQAGLRVLSVPEREALLNECIEAGVLGAASLAATPWELAYVDVQRRRLRSLLRPWLVAELARPAFTVRDQERVTQGVHIGPLQLDLRVDRIDDTAAGALIIDYKTGAATPADWLSERPDAPQLPLYAVLADSSHLAGVAFALLRAGEDLDLKGYADSPAVLPRSSKIPAGSLSAQVDGWREVLTTLAIAFAEGDASVAPKSYPKTCARCAQRILCRLDVATLEEVGEDDDLDGGFVDAQQGAAGVESAYG